MNELSADRLAERVGRLEDEAAIRRLILSYGPAADAGLTAFAAGVWLEDGVYDWDAQRCAARGKRRPSTRCCSAMATRDSWPREWRISPGHSWSRSTATGPPPSTIRLIMRREERRFYLWRVSAVRWDIERSGSTWRVRRRTNRLLDETGAGRELSATR